MVAVSFATQTITVIRPGVIVERGDDYRDWDTATEHDIAGCFLQPLSGDDTAFAGAQENEGGTARDGWETRWKLHAPIDADIERDDRIRGADGIEYDIAGQVKRWTGPGSLSHTELTLRRVDG